MGKYNRASRTTKLQKLTDDLVVGAVAPEVKEKINNLMEKQPNEVPAPIVKTVSLAKQVKEVAKVVINGEGKQDPGHTGKAGNPEVMKPATPAPVQPMQTAPNLPKPMQDPEPEIGKTPAELKVMNVYQKLSLARSIVGGMQLKKSGANDEAGFNYFELADFVPMLNKLGDRIGIMPQFSMTNDLATLKVVNTDKPKEVAEFSIPTADLVMADAEGKVAEGIQVLGGKTTYLRRYLYQIAFEISVKDTVDSRGKTPPKPIDELDQADIDKINATGDIDSLAQVCKDIKARKGFNKNVALLKHYTAKKEALGL